MLYFIIYNRYQDKFVYTTPSLTFQKIYVSKILRKKILKLISSPGSFIILWGVPKRVSLKIRSQIALHSLLTWASTSKILVDFINKVDVQNNILHTLREASHASEKAIFPV